MLTVVFRSFVPILDEERSQDWHLRISEDFCVGETADRKDPR